MRKCLRCEQPKNEEDFYKVASHPNGYPYCKLCHRKTNTSENIRKSASRYLQKNYDKKKQYNLGWYEQNKERIKALYEANKEKKKAQTALYRKTPRGKALRNASQIKRNRLIAQATPKWANDKAIIQMYEQAVSTGMTVDHIIPLTNTHVCGLHTEANLQLLTKQENSRKRNSFVGG
jgi:hypothetical protein